MPADKREFAQILNDDDQRHKSPARLEAFESTERAASPARRPSPPRRRVRVSFPRLGLRSPPLAQDAPAIAEKAGKGMTERKTSSGSYRRLALISRSALRP